MTVIKADNLSYTYNMGTNNQLTAVDNITISIEAGEIIGVIGQTGSGKSTFVQMLNGLIEPTSGDIYIKGKSIKDKSFDKKNLCFDIGLVFQYPEYQLFEEKVCDDIAFGPRNKGIGGNDLKDVVNEAIRFVGMDESILNKSPFELSGGEKRRVAIAGIIAMNPDVLILDEPTAGLDPMGHEQLMHSILNYHNNRKNTIIFISHVMEDVAMISDRIMVFDKGRLLMFDSPRNVFSNKLELNKIGLEVPKITEVMCEINELGYNVNPGIVTVEQGENEILDLFRERKLR